MPMKFTFLGEKAGVIVLDAHLNSESEKSLVSCFTNSGNNNIDTVILNFRPVDLMDSGGLSALVKVSAMAKNNKIKLFVFGLGNRYQQIFGMTGLDTELKPINDNNKTSLSPDLIKTLNKKKVRTGKQSDAGWAPLVSRLHMAEKPVGAFGWNMEGRRVTGQAHGFGPMWEKTYWLDIEQPAFTGKEVMLALQKHFVEFQPPVNSFYPTSRGIAPGEIILIDSRTPGGIVSTGVMVLYKDDRSFTFITPQGHPESGWVTFSMDERHNSIYVQIQGLVRSSDPFFETAFALAGAKLQETIWKHVLSSLAAYLGVNETVQMKKCKPAGNYQWRKSFNIWFNAQIRSLPLNAAALFTRRH